MQAKRGKGKGAPSPKRKGSEASSDLASGKQNSDDDHEEESDDCNENDSAENNDSASTKASCKEGNPTSQFVIRSQKSRSISKVFLISVVSSMPWLKWLSPWNALV